MSKEVGGKDSHIEDALKHSKRNWSGEGDKKFKIKDIKKLWGFYISSTLSLKRWGFSGDIKAENYKSHDPIIGKPILIPYSVRKQLSINKFGIIDINTLEGQYLNATIERCNNKGRIPLYLGKIEEGAGYEQ